MSRHSSLHWIVLVALLAASASLLILDLAYLLIGSQELFPTDERQEAVRLVAGVGAIGLGAVVWLLFRQIRRRSSTP